MILYTHVICVGGLMMKTHKVILASSVLLVLFTLIGINIYQSLSEAEETITELNADKEIRDELYIDAKQVFEMLEQARNEQRELTIGEKQLVTEFDTKYDRDTVELTHTETMIVLQLLLMSRETAPTSKLASEQNRYEEYKGYLLEYVEFD